MEKNNKVPASVDAYIRSFPPEVRKKLTQLRQLVLAQAPDAEEKIAYKMPSYYLNGPLVYFAGYVRHIGFYAGASAVGTFSEKLTRYKTSKGTVQFPLDAPLPVALIKQMVKFRVAESKAR